VKLRRGLVLTAEVAEERMLALISETLAKSRVESRHDVERLKLKLAKELKLNRIPNNLELLAHAKPEYREKLSRILRKKEVKTLSGVSIITVVAPIYFCPHGKCIYCPGGVADGTPQSYTGAEEAVKLASSVMYDPYKQVQKQVRKLMEMGHPVDKIELIIIGGTFSAMPLEFQRNFLKRCVDAVNQRDASSLEEALQIAEHAERRISGILVETKPDWAKFNHANSLLEMGVTRVEIGVQALDDEIYRIVNRGHTLQDVVDATADLKDLAFKVGYHIMPNLPGSDPDKDLKMFRQLFEDDRFRPDHLKIYPTLVLPRTGLYRLWLEGGYKPYDDETLVKLLAECLKHVPPYVRIQRIQREIPLDITIDGNRIPNLRQAVEEYMRVRGWVCRCIRCREVGHKIKREGIKPNFDKIRINTITYPASGGVETFISVDEVEHDALLGFIRLRIPSRELRVEIRRASLVRELHVYGYMTPVGKKLDGDGVQHRGIGRMLLAEAEKIAYEKYDRKKIVVISGVGVREYYAKLGYFKEGPYMVKTVG